MKYLIILCASLSVLIAPKAWAQFDSIPKISGTQNSLLLSYRLSSNPDLGVPASPTLNESLGFSKSTPIPAPPGTKNPFVAAALSLLIPGAGEYYVGDHIWRGMIFTGIEAGLWIEWAHWNNLGDNSTAAYHSFSDQHWSVQSYSSYLDTTLVEEKLSAVADPKNLHSINQAETTLDSLSVSQTDLNFSHRLIAGGQSIYYDLISSFVQFQPGWDNINDYNTAGSMRNTANDQYGTAENFLWGIIANHFLSAVDAVLLASDHNSRLRLHGDLIRAQLPNGAYGYIPTANIEYTF